jgi:hypothetical protein
MNTDNEKDFKNFKKFIQNKIEAESLAVSDVFSLLQPQKFSYQRNAYPYQFRELKSEILFNDNENKVIIKKNLGNFSTEKK